MKLIKIAAGALNQTPLDWEGNYRRIRDIIKEADDSEVDLLCLPELCITGYGCEDAFLSNDVQVRALDMLGRIAEITRHTVCVGLPVVVRNALYNCTALIQGGTILGLVAKQHLAGDGIHYEPRWFKAWPAGCCGQLRHEDNIQIPIGDLCFNLGGVRIGFEICEDAWVAERPGAVLARKGVDIILNPSASHFSFGKQEIRKRFVIEGSRAFAATYVYANLLGNEAGRAIYDGECLIATGGQLIAQGSRFSMSPSQLTIAVVDVDATRTQQISTSSFSPEFTGTEEWCNGESLPWYTDKVRTPPCEPHPPTTKNQEFREAVTLGLYDYLRKSRSKGFVISLSGGADSAACAYLVRLMIGRGIVELGLAGFCRSVGISYQDEGSHNQELEVASVCRQLLTCVYQKTRNSSDTTFDAAFAVAGDAGAKFHLLDVEEVVKAYTSMVSVALQHEFDWDKDDIALQNIQARSRAPSVWMIANVEQKLLITTSNRSEAAVGYCTMDGDTAGSLAPLAGIDKAFLREWLRGLEITFKGVSLVNRQAPTAELRPGESQTDERDLMPYPILEAIEDLAILERRSPREVFVLLRDGLGESRPPLKVLHTYVERFFRLWCRNQWKRERYALSFHLDAKNLDPRSWCRFPVLSGGYEVELADLKAELGF